MNPPNDNGDFEYVQQDSWVSRHPSASITLGVGCFTLIAAAGSVWLERQQAPMFEQLKRRDESMAGFMIEAQRRTDSSLEKIAASAGIKLDARHPELVRAETAVMDIRERVQ